MSAEDVPSVDRATAMDPEDEMLLLLVHASAEPLGARFAARSLTQRGMTMSEATVSRALSRLDAMGLTVALAHKGRVLTPAGRALAEERIQRGQRDERFSRAMDLRNVQEMLDWLAAREVLEAHAAELAAERRTDEQLAALEESLSVHSQHLSGGRDPSTTGYGFHQLLMEASDSPIFIALISTLYDGEFLRVERSLDAILARRGSLATSLTFHEEIVEAVRNRRPDAASAAMRAHLRHIHNEVNEYGRLPE